MFDIPTSLSFSSGEICPNRLLRSKVSVFP
nr:MAG TPA: hypothetical protein [Caudoviricetes sp.]